MSSYAKGTRKPKSGQLIRDISIGGYKIGAGTAITILLAALYVLFLAGIKLEDSSDAATLSIFSLVIFILLDYAVRAGRLPGLKPFIGLIDAFLALSALASVWEIVVYLGLINLSGISGPVKPVLMTISAAVISLVLIYGVLYFGKDKLMDSKLKEIYVNGIGVRSMALGAAGLVICLILGIGIVYVLFGGSTKVTGSVLSLVLLALIFAILAAAYEELWFRGLLLSRIMPLTGKANANILQAVVFGFFEAFAVFTLTGQPLYLPIFLVIGGLLGYYWGKMTLDDKSLLAPILLHVGFYLLIGLPILASMV
jgi:membrane protease YdiL (CAAX protease family)